MENGLLDRVEGNANVHRWFEQTQLEKGDSIAMGYMSELSGYTRISVIQNNLQELKEIWDQWGNETKQLFYGNYRDLPYLLDVQVDEHLFRALAQFWNPAYSCFTFGEVDLVPTIEEYTALLRCLRFQVDRIYSRAANVPTFWKKLMTITGMSEQWITARIKEKGKCKCISWDTLKGLILTHPDETKKVDVFALSLYRLMVFPRALGYVDEATTDLFHRLSKRVTSVLAILAETFRSLGTCRKASADRRVDVPEENWIALLQNLQLKDVEWRAPWMIPGEILYRCGNFDWFMPATHGLTQSEFAYRGADYKKMVGEISSAWNKTCQLKGVAISLATTLEYVEWRGRRINANILEPSVEGARPMEEYLQKMEVEKERKEKRKIEEDRDDLKEHYKKAQLSLRRARVGGSSDQLQKEVQEGKARAEYWEKKFQEMQSHDPTIELKELKNKVEDLETALYEGKLQIEQLEMQENYLKRELHQSKEQVKERDHVMGEAIAQIREVAEYVQDLAVRADVLSLMYGPSSDIGRELALLLDRVKTLGIRAKAYL
ncbi:hypothetical protein CXB51_001978 [Gossypium anomalum]|uniref:DUF7745 domain-containing protein n=1 Tax=Gossypium anomalum TaxID=47600 RepID=A0A8J5ZN28_9ROSI|nr:hypothetical protein CXB51_001978 [Gossypium anomalum]